MDFRIRPLHVVAIGSCLVLAGCGGGGGDDATPLTIVETPDGRILAGAEEIVAGDYVSRTFPLLFALVVDGSPQSNTSAAEGTIEVVDADTLIITLPGETPSRFDRSSSTQFTEAGGGVVFTVEDFGGSQYFFKSGGAPELGFVAAYGFETPVVSRPVSARYTAVSAADVYFAPDGSQFGLGVNGAGTVDLQANFSGSGGTITGVLLDGSQTIDFLNDGTADDEVFIRTTLDAVINEGGFTGTVDGSSSVSIAGGPAQDLNLVLSNSSATGKFYGTAAQAASGVYGADATFSPPGQADETGRLSGFFFATR